MNHHTRQARLDHEPTIAAAQRAADALAVQYAFLAADAARRRELARARLGFSG